ncbi:MAG TPA: glycosyltransferase family 4 protein [Methanoregulaceae archaeon]|nr:glycosyltransferase family 4 protein [Methanoregulaceae archaeon]HQJ87342.1 glycosyltransferase family 4 protein [Methanoregulaceae archaeon]
MKILRVASDLYPSVVGGYGIHVHEMSRMQVALGHDVTVLTANPDHLPEEEFIDGYRVIRFNHSIRMVGNTISPTLFFQLMEMRNEYDVIHAHSHLFFPTNVCALVKKYGSSPLVITNHGIMSASAPHWLNVGYMNTLGRWTLNSADRVICYTPQERERLILEFGVHPEGIAVIPNGVNTDVFHPGVTRVDDESRRLLWVGRYVKGKGVAFLIHAAARLVQEIPNLCITLVGEGPEEEAIRQLVSELRLEETVEFLPFMPYDQMPAQYRRAEMLVLPSLHEGVPRTMLEAMACGRPVVISEFEHLRHLVEGAGLMFPKGDVGALAAAIRRLLESPEEAASLGQQGRETIIRQNSWRNTVDSTLDLYRELATA